MVPVVLVLLAAGTLTVMAHRQDSADQRREQEALEQIAGHVRSYEDVVRGEGRNGFASRARAQDAARQYQGVLVSYARSDRSLTTLVRFFATYEDTGFFGVSATRAYRCYSIRFPEGAGGGPSRTAVPLKECRPT
ncbi:hypothetical protein [Streptomyces sp. NPDC059651]|uniref:hypothetical protein n=1 Tax=unclassified Streptomyces TaxID=2593676 RepID=UPI003679C7C2